MTSLLPSLPGWWFPRWSFWLYPCIGSLADGTRLQSLCFCVTGRWQLISYFPTFFTCPTLRPLPPTLMTDSAMCCHNISFLFSVTPFWKCEVNTSCSISTNKIKFSKLHSFFSIVYYGTYEMYTRNYKSYKQIEIALFPYIHTYTLVSMFTAFQAAVAFALALQFLVFQLQVLVREHCTEVSTCSVLMSLGCLGFNEAIVCISGTLPTLPHVWGGWSGIAGNNNDNKILI